MDQFWHHGHLKLQETVEMERLVLPGQKLNSGFFSIGSTARAVSRP